MIKVIIGSKGSGKTKKIIDAANASLAEAKGNVVFISNTSKYSKEINYNIRFVNAAEYLSTQEELVGFIRGMIAGNGDIECFYIDGLARIIGKRAPEMEELYKIFEDISQRRKVDFVITVSEEPDSIPTFVKKYE